MAALRFLASEAASVTLFGLLCWREELGMREIYASYALCDLLLTPGRTMFSFGASEGWRWFLPPFKGKRLTFSGVSSQRGVGLCLWLLCLFSCAAFLVSGDDLWLKALFICYSLFLVEDVAFWRSHLLLHLTYNVCLADKEQFPYAILFSMARLWLASGIGKLTPEFWSHWHPFILQRGSPIYGALLSRFSSSDSKLPLQRALRWHSFIGGCLESCFPLLLLAGPSMRLPAYFLCLAMHIYIILGFFAPMLWNVTAILIVSRVTTAGFYDGPSLDMMWNHITMYHASELIIALCWLCSNFGLAFNAFFNNNIHGGNWPTRHIFVRKSMAARVLGETSSVPKQFQPQEDWTEVVDPWCAVALTDSFKRVSLDSADPSEFVRVPLFFFWIRLDLFWNQCVIDDFAQKAIVKEFLNECGAHDDVRIVEIGSISWLRRRRIQPLPPSSASE